MSIRHSFVDLGLSDGEPLLPRIDHPVMDQMLREERAPFAFEAERVRVPALTSRVVRDRIFRRVVLRAYDERCVITGLKLINGGVRAEVEAAHIRPVEANGPDVVSNGLAPDELLQKLIGMSIRRISISDRTETPGVRTRLMMRSHS